MSPQVTPPESSPHAPGAAHGRGTAPCWHSGGGKGSERGGGEGGGGVVRHWGSQAGPAWRAVSRPPTLPPGFPKVTASRCRQRPGHAPVFGGSQWARRASTLWSLLDKRQGDRDRALGRPNGGDTAPGPRSPLCPGILRKSSLTYASRFFLWSVEATGP